MDEESNPLNDYTDAEIVERVRRGDVQAYGTLVDRYQRTLLAAVLAVVKDVHAAQDVVQDVFVQCFIKIATLRDASRYGGWLLTVGGREAIRAAKRTRRTPMRLAADDPAPDQDPMATSFTEPLLNDEREWLLNGVRRLPEHERVAVSLRYFEGHSVHDIAQITGRPVGTVTKQLSRALDRLRHELRPLNGTAQAENALCQIQKSKMG